MFFFLHVNADFYLLQTHVSIVRAYLAYGEKSPYAFEVYFVQYRLKKKNVYQFISAMNRSNKIKLLIMTWSPLNYKHWRW